MRWSMPNHPCEFELPADWWADAGMEGFTARAATYAYPSIGNVIVVPLRQVQPLRRAAENDWRGFGRSRMISVLNGIASGAEIEPVELLVLRCEHHPSPSYRYGVYDGFHRFYASIAAGFECLPGIIRSDCRISSGEPDIASGA